MTAVREALAASMSEKDLLAKVRTLARLLGWTTYHTHRSDHSEAGFPDLVMVKGSRLLFVELKSEKGRTSPAQEDWWRKLRLAGQEYQLWRCHHWLDGTIDEELRR